MTAAAARQMVDAGRKRRRAGNLGLPRAPALIDIPMPLACGMGGFAAFLREHVQLEREPQSPYTSMFPPPKMLKSNDGVIQSALGDVSREEMVALCSDADMQGHWPLVIKAHATNYTLRQPNSGPAIEAPWALVISDATKLQLKSHLQQRQHRCLLHRHLQHRYHGDL